MKNLKTIFACLLMAVLSIGQVWATPTEESVTLSSGTFTTDHITWSAADGNITISQLKGSSSTAVNSSYVSAPRVYKGHVLSFVAADGYKINSIEITCNGTYYGNSMTAGTVYSSNTVTDNTTDVSRTWASTSGGTHLVSAVDDGGLSAIYIQNVASSTNTQLRFTALKVYYTSSGGGTEKTNLSVPTGMSSGTPGVNSATLSWNAVENADGYALTIGTNDPITTGFTTSAGVVSYNLTGLDAETTYTWKVKATSTDTEHYNNSADCAAQEFTTAEDPSQKVLTFDVSSNPGEWPTTNSTTTTNYTYTLNAVDYTFALNNVKSNSGYLMLTAVAKLGLPAINGYKLVKVVASNSGGCSTSTQVAVTSDESGTAVSGGEAQTWGTVSSSYTYNLSGTDYNTMYYLYVTKKNSQLVQLKLTYVPRPAVESIAIETVPTKTTYTANENFDPAGMVITVNYEGGASEDVAYNNTTASDFTFSPATDVALNATHTSVTVTYGTKTANQAITVNRIATTLAWSAPSYTANIGASYTFPTLTKTPAALEGVTFSSSNTAVVETISAAGVPTVKGTGTTTITAEFAQTNVYAAATPATYTLTINEASSPSLSVDPASLSFGPIAVDGTQEKTFALIGENLTEDASLAISGTGAAMFSVASSVAKDGSGAINTNVTVTYNPTAAGTHTATLTISSEGATPVEVALSGEAKTNHAITWSVNGAALSGAALDGVTTSVLDGGNVTALPADPADNTLACANTFMGWSRHNWNSTPKTASDYDDLFKAPAGAGTIEESTTFYAVFATVNNGSDQDNDGPSWERDETTDTYTDGYTFSSTASAKTGYYQDKSSGTGELKLYHTTTPIFSSTPKSVTLTASIGAGQNNTEFTNYVYAQLLDKDGNGIGNAIQVNSSLTIASASGDTYTPTFDLTGITSAYGVMLYHEKESGKNIRYYSFSLSFVTSGTTTTDYVTKCAAVAVPTFSVDPADGPFNAAQSVEISCATAESTIYYTTNGSTPTSSSTLYEGPVSVNESMTLKAIAIKGDDKSDVAEAAYELKVATPEITGNTSFVSTATVTITAAAGTTIYYTDDDSDPASSETKKTYSAPFTVESTTTIKAIATKTNWTSSDVATQTFTKITPISVATALENIDALSNNGTIADQYVKGLISQIVSYNSGNTITYYISDDGTTTSQLQVYKGSAGVANGGNTFTSETDLKVGEEVVVFGTLKKFKSGSNPVVPEFVNPNEIVAYKPHSPLAWSANAYTAELTGENTFPALSGTAGLTITYSSSDATKASFADASVYEITLNAVTGEDPVTITASSAATDDYVATSVSYALTIQESVVRYTLDYVCNEATSGCPETTHLTDQTNVPSPLPTVAKDGKNFGGWYLESTFENLATAGDPLTGNTTLYAQWLEPYTVAQALTMIDALADNGTTGNVYVAGVVTDDEVEVASNVATYYIKDAGESNSLMVYKGNGLGNTNVSEGDILESDQVVVYGALKKYVKNTTTTPEVVNPNYIYSRVRPTTEVTGVTLPATAIVRVGSTITLTPTIAPNNATNKNVSWSVISGNTYAEVSDAGVVTGLIAGGDAVIQVETEDGGFTASCTVSVGAARPDFTEDDHEWIKITSASKLVAGRFYVIASETKGKTAKNTISSNRLDQVASTFEDGRISVGNLGTNTAIFELGGVSGAWTLNEVTNEANTGLLSYNADKKVEWAGTNTTWDISIENGNATIAAVSASTERILHNNSSSWFTVYASATSNSMLLPQLYMWAELSHAVTFDANGGVPGSVPGIERTDEGKIIIPATEPTHSDVAKAFAGWYKDGAPSTLYNAGDEFATNEDVTLYAKWNTVPTYTVSYSANGGTGAAPAEPVTVKAGTTITVVENTGYTNPGKTFDGWLVTYNNGTEQTIDLDENSQFSMPAYNVVIKATWAEESNQKWALVTAASQLVAGAKYIIAAAGYDYAMAGQKTNNRDATAVVKRNEGAQLKGTASMQVITLEGTTGAWEFNTGAGYLYAAASGSNYLKTQETNDINGKWTITISEGVASIVASGSSNRNVMQFNNGSSKLFSCYSSASEKAVALYKEIPMTEITTNDMDQDDVPDGGDMTIKEDKTWTVSSAKEVGDVYMEEGAVIANSAAVTANDLYFKTKAGKSNQIHEASQLNVIGDLYYDVQLCSGDLNADYWYIIAVPFDVNINDGISLADGTPMINGVDYEVWIYDTQKRAQTTNGWKRANGKMEAGKAYFIGFNPGMPNTVRLKAAPGWKDHLFSGSSLALTKTAEEASAGVHDNWNGIANPKMRYVGIDKENVQMYSNEAHTFSAYTGTAYDFVVGTAFFVKSTGNVNIADGSHSQFLAPKRDAERKLGYEVRITPAEAAEFDNQIIVRASESANGEYNSNRDMLTLNEATSKSAALLWTENYGDKRLAIEEAPLVNSSASYVLGIYAPADGEYTISTPQAKEDVSLYLTRNGRVIWDLTAAPYTLDLTKGNTTGYGLRIVAAPKATTDLEDVQGNKVQCTKVLINNHVFILRGEQLYDATGRLVK